MGLDTLSRGTLRRALLAALRQACRPRSPGTDRRGQIPHMAPIAEHPAEVGHQHPVESLGRRPHHGSMEGSAVGSLVERTTRLIPLVRMDGTDERSAREGFTQKLQCIPAPLRKMLTYDRGKEMAEHERQAQ